MERNREARRATMAASVNGLSRRRHRSSSLRDSPEEDGPVEMHEPGRLRDRGVKKDRDRDRDRDRERDRSSRSKRRRGDRLIHGSNRDDVGEESSEESVNDEEDEDDDEGGGGGSAVNGGAAVRMLPPNPAAVASISSSLTNHHQQQQQHRKSFLPSVAAKVFRPVGSGWKSTDEMIGFTVPRKARSASTKRSHEIWMSGGGGGSGGGGVEQIHRQASTSPVRPTPTPSPAAAAPISPSSSNVSVRKKIKSNGPKLRPPKSSSKSSSSNPEELEIEIAEVLYGLKTHSQGPSKKDNDSNNNNNNNNNKSSSDAKSRVSSPISNSTSTAPQSSVFPQNSSSSATPLSAVAPKRKRPRQVSDNLGSFIRNSPISSTTTATMKVEIDQPTKNEISGQNPEKNSGSVTENGGVSHDFASSVQPETPPPESGTGESKPVIEESRESRDLAKEEVVVTTSPKKESSAVRPEDDDHEDSKGTKVNLTNPDIESRRDEKFQIDLMVTPPQLRSSPEREAGEMNFVAAAEQKPVVSEAHAQMRTTRNKDKEEEKGVKSESGGGDEAVNVVVEPELKKAKATDAETDKPVVVVNSSNSSKERNNIDLQLDLEKSETVSSINKLHSHTHKQPKASRDEQPPHTENTTQSGSLPLPMSMASWPGGLPSMGYMAPLQGVVSMDGSPVVPSTPPLFSQPRPKRCATHCYIARKIHYLQQCMKMNPFWSAAAGSASLFGTKPCNLNVVPSTELHGNIAGRSVNTVVQEKGQGLSIFPGHSGKDKGSPNLADAHRKQQILIQQALAPGAPPNNILHGPAFIFPLNQQQAAAAAAASVRPGTAKSPTTGGSVASTSASNSTSMNGSATAAPTAAALGFNYPNVPGNETPYLAILQGNAYPFQIPAVGAPPTYRGTHAQAMPYFNGSFYSSQMIHPSQLQQQQQQPSTQQQQVQQGHQNTSISSGSSSSQKHLQSQQQRQHGSSTNGGNGNGNGNMQSFSASKNRSSQASQQQQPNQHLSTSYQNRQLESEAGGEDSPSNAADSRVSRAPISLYGPNFAMPFQHQNFALMTPPPPLAGANVGGGNQGEKKQQQQPQQQGLKPGVESLPPQTFAMSFASMPPGIDISSMAQNHAVLQSLPEANRQSFQIMAAAAQAAQPKKNFRVSDEGKTGGGDSSSVDEEKKGSAGKIPVSVGQSIVFSRPDLTDASASNIPGSTVIDSSARTLNLVSAPSRSSRSSMPNAIGIVNSPPNSQMQAHLQYQPQHMLHLQKHHQQQQQLAPTAAARNKTPATCNGSVYSDHLNTSSSAAAAKFSTVLSSAFPQQNLGQSSSSSPAQSPQWKNSARTTSQIPSSLASSTTSSLKNLPQQQARTQQSHTQISFGAGQKSTPPPQGQQAPNSHQSQSPPMMVGSPSTSSISKGAGGSPRMSTSTSQGNKAAQPSTLSSQQSKNSASVPSRKSSPVGSRNVPPILGNPHITSSSTGTKSQMQQQQLPKHTVQQPQLFFTSAYVQAQGPHSTGASSTVSTTGGYYIQRRRPEQQQQSQQQNSFAAMSSTGMLSLCPPVTLASTSTSDAKAVAAAASTMKGGSGGLTPQSIPHPVQFAGQSSGNSHHLVPPGFSNVHTVPAAVVKPAEQKQPAGNRGCLTRK